MCVFWLQGGRPQDNLSFYIFMLLEAVRTGSPLLPQIKIIHVLILSLEVIFQEKKRYYDQAISANLCVWLGHQGYCLDVRKTQPIVFFCPYLTSLFFNWVFLLWNNYGKRTAANKRKRCILNELSTREWSRLCLTLNCHGRIHGSSDPTSSISTELSPNQTGKI